MPPELIFILVLIVFSVLENALKGKKKKGGPHRGAARDRSASRLAASPARIGPRGVGQSEGEPRTSGESRTIPAQRDRASDMVPEDLWEEIAALARGDVDETLRRRRARARAEAERARRQGTAPGPRRSSGPPGQTRPVPSRSAPSPSGDARPSPGDEAPAVLTPAGPHTDPPIERAPLPGGLPRRAVEGGAPGVRGRGRADGARQPSPPGLPHLRPGAFDSGVVHSGQNCGGAPDGPAAGEAARSRSKPSSPKVRGRFRGPGALRNAIIAREVLGRPLALREYGRRGDVVRVGRPVTP